jgi:prepilin-type processing-associated H-X9-DG protein
VKKDQVAFAFDPIWVLAQMPTAALRNPQTALGSTVGMVAPLLDQTTGYAVGLDLDDGLGIDLVATCHSEDGAKRVSETLQALITLAKNALPGLRQQVLAQPAPSREAPLRALGLVETLLANARAEVEAGNRVVRLRSRSDGDVASVVQTFVPAVSAARTAARRSQSVNNIKLIGLAMHNFAADNGHFPPAVIRPADGKPPYSWRVAILPYLDQNDLFKEYNFNEPWDSAANRKLIDKKPATYGHPSDESGHTAYFVVTGEPTLFPPGNPGVKLSDVVDGLSNTLMVVEAKRDVPWTKPEDIEYDPAKPMPEFGGFTNDGFNAGFADGSVKFLKETINPIVLRALFTRNGGEVVSADALSPPPPGPMPTTPAPLPSPTETLRRR